jgi:ribose-phosphate pyrophosphokinase
MMERGALSVRAICTHGVLSGKAYENIENSKLKELIITDTIPQRKEGGKIKVVPVAGLFAKVVRNILHHESISSHFIV